MVSLLLSVMINGLLLKFSRNLGTRSNNENLVRWSSQTKPAVGGISFYILFLISILALSFFFKQNNFFLNIRSLGIIASASLAFLMGLFDDAYNTKVPIKLFAQITCGAILIATGTTIHLFGFWPADYVLTMIWVIGLMNSVNMLDNMDGITSTVSLFIFLAILVNAFIFPQLNTPANILLIGMIASMIGFLFFNWNPAKMYMGDTGSQFLGLVIAAATIIYLWNFPEANHMTFHSRQAMAAIILLSLPIIDTFTVSIKRIRRGTSPFVGGKDHTTHHLSYLGLSDRQVALVFAGISLVNLLLTTLILMIPGWNHWYVAIFGIYFVALFITLFTIASKNQH